MRNDEVVSTDCELAYRKKTAPPQHRSPCFLVRPFLKQFAHEDLDPEHAQTISEHLQEGCEKCLDRLAEVILQLQREREELDAAEIAAEEYLENCVERGFFVITETGEA